MEKKKGGVRLLFSVVTADLRQDPPGGRAGKRPRRPDQCCCGSGDKSREELTESGLLTEAGGIV